MASQGILHFVLHPCEVGPAHAQLAGNLLEGSSVVGVHQAAQAHHSHLGIVWVGVEALLQLCYAALQHLPAPSGRFMRHWHDSCLELAVARTDSLRDALHALRNIG